MPYSRDIKYVLIVYFIFYFGVLLYYGFNQQFLLQYNPISFTHNRDLLELLIISAGLPTFMLQHPVTFIIADCMMILVPVLILIYYFLVKSMSSLLGVLFTCCIGLYLCLQNIFVQSHPENLMGIFMLSFCFVTNNPKRFYQILDAGRYYLIYIFVSAAMWKILRGNVIDLDHFSNILAVHHANILNRECHLFYCSLMKYLIDNPYVSYITYILAIIMELVFIVGVFTQRMDKWLLFTAILFFTLDQFIMRIIFWPLMVLGITFLITLKSDDWKRKTYCS